MDLHTHIPESRGDANQRLSRFVSDEGTRLFLLKNLYRTDDGFLLRVNVPVLKAKVKEVMTFTVANYDGPTLFLAGEHSDYILPEDYAKITQFFPKSTIITIPKAGHWPHVENPVTFAAEVANFLGIR